MKGPAPVHRVATLAGLGFALGWPGVLQLVQPHQHLGNAREDEVLIALEWSALIILFAIVVFWERLPPLRSLGIVALQRIDVIIVVGLALAGVALAILLAHTHPVVSKGDMIAQARALPLWLRLALVVTAGICEEVFFRGYVLERIRALGGRSWLGILIGTVIFTLAHIPRYGFSPDLFPVAFIGGTLSLLYVWRRNLIPCMALHCFIDAIGLLILPAVASFSLP